MRYAAIIAALFFAWAFYFYAEGRCQQCITDADCELWCGKEH